MTHVLLVGQDKGGAGKTVAVRAIAECLPQAEIVELEASPRLVELEDRVKFFPVRATREEVDRTGGAIARSEFDGPMNALATAQAPMVVDIGANAASSFLPLIASAAARFERRGVTFAFLTVMTAEPGALASAPQLIELARPFAKALFAIENRVEDAVDPAFLKSLGKNIEISVFEKIVLDERANDLLKKGGLRFIGEDLEASEDRLIERIGFNEAGRVIADLTRFRHAAMHAVAPAARWLEG